MAAGSQEAPKTDEITRVDNEINAVEPQVTGEWKVITFKIDSGAVDNVILKSVGDVFPIKPTSLSKLNKLSNSERNPDQESWTERHQRIH